MGHNDIETWVMEVHTGESWGAKTDLVSSRESYVYLVFKISNEEGRNILHSTEVLFSTFKCMEPRQ